MPRMVLSDVRKTEIVDTSRVLKTAARSRVRPVGKPNGVRIEEVHNVPHDAVPGLSGWRYAGPDLSEGAMPAVIYFALTASQSLGLDPYNGLTRALLETNGPTRVRVFSMNLPFHGSMEQNHVAFRSWAQSYENERDLVSECCDRAMLGVNELVDRGLVCPDSIAVAGLSRGALIASLLAARLDNVKVVLGLAPVTSLSSLSDFQDIRNPAGRELLDRLNLLHHSESLARRSVRFYMGNRDVRVGTRNAFDVIERLAEDAFNLGQRSPRAELMMYPSIGMDGHGTPPNVFDEGAAWVRRELASAL